MAVDAGWKSEEFILHDLAPGGREMWISSVGGAVKKKEDRFLT